MESVPKSFLTMVFMDEPLSDEWLPNIIINVRIVWSVTVLMIKERLVEMHTTCIISAQAEIFRKQETLKKLIKKNNAH